MFTGLTAFLQPIVAQLCQR